MVAGLKSYTSHTMDSCGAIETILSLYMIDAGFIAPTLNMNKIDERCAMIQHTVNLLEKDISIAAVQNFAFGGMNTCLLVKTRPIISQSYSTSCQKKVPFQSTGENK